jgi:hypothetical protein
MVAPQPAALLADANATRVAAPTRIGGRYHVVERLGRGGMGAVYRVRDSSGGAELALKQL